MRTHHPVIVVIAFPLIATACNRRLPPAAAAPDGSGSDRESSVGVRDRCRAVGHLTLNGEE